MAVDLNADPSADVAYNFQAPAVQGQQVQATQTFGVAALDPKLQQTLSQVLRPEENGQRAIQVDPQLADDVDRIGADVNMCQGSPGLLGDIVGAAGKLVENVAEAKADLTANQPAPVVVEPETPDVQQAWTPPSNMMA